MDNNVMKTYTHESTEARHHVQYDQGILFHGCISFINVFNETRTTLRLLFLSKFKIIDFMYQLYKKNTGQSLSILHFHGT